MPALLAAGFFTLGPCPSLAAAVSQYRWPWRRWLSRWWSVKQKHWVLPRTNSRKRKRNTQQIYIYNIYIYIQKNESCWRHCVKDFCWHCCPSVCLCEAKSVSNCRNDSSTWEWRRWSTSPTKRPMTAPLSNEGTNSPAGTPSPNLGCGWLWQLWTCERRRVRRKDLLKNKAFWETPDVAIHPCGPKQNPSMRVTWSHKHYQGVLTGGPWGHEGNDQWPVASGASITESLDPMDPDMGVSENVVYP